MSQSMTLPISQIRANPVALRNVDRESEAFVALRDSVGDPRIGILNPISVRQRSETIDGETVNYYEVIDGLHRFTAASEVGLSEIPVLVKDLDETEAFLAQIIGNAMKVETKPVQYTKHLQRVIGANPTWTMVDLANRLHKSPSWLNQRFGLLKLNPEVQTLVDEGKIAVTNAVILAKLPHDEQLNFVDTAMTQNSTEFGPLVQARVKEIKEAEAKGQAPKEAGFVATSRPRTKSELEDELNSLSATSPLFANCKGRDEVAREVLKWVLSLDEPTVSVKRAQYEERKQRLAEEQAKRKAERANKKAQEAAEAASKAQAEAAAVTAG